MVQRERDTDPRLDRKTTEEGFAKFEKTLKAMLATPPPKKEAKGKPARKVKKRTN